MLGTRQDYSWSECVLSLWATLTLTLLAVTSLLLRYVTSPLSCFMPAHFDNSQVDYASQLCFHSNYISSPVAPPAMDGGMEDSASRLTFHQWLPFFLGVAATLCLLPHATWRVLSGFLWMDAHELTRVVATNQQHNAAARHVMLRDCALLLHAGLKGGNSVLALAALGRKAMACVVCFLQMLLMLLVFRPRLDGQHDSARGGFIANVSESLPLPVDSFTCSFSIAIMGKVQKFQVMCFLSPAPVYTKGLVFLVYFFLVLFVLCTLDLATWTMRLAVPRLKDMTLQRSLSLASQSGGRAEGHAHLSGFLNSLGLDGRWVVGVVGDRCGALAAADLTHHLWQVFQDSPTAGQASAPPVISPVESSGTASGGPGKEESGGDVAMVTISSKDGDKPAEDDERGKEC